MRKLWIAGPVGKLEAALRVAAEPRAAAVIAHPHPVYGGTLDNPVVFHADRELNRAGLTTLRFNFRSVGEATASTTRVEGRSAMSRRRRRGSAIWRPASR
jgi:alpha/beta superfamily hydrolase